MIKPATSKAKPTNLIFTGAIGAIVVNVFGCNSILTSRGDRGTLDPNLLEALSNML